MITTSVYLLRHILPRNKKLSKTWLNQRLKLAKRMQSESLVIPIDTVQSISQKEFEKNYLKKGIPLIFSQQAKQWGCCKKWGFNFFAKNFQNKKFKILDGPGLVEKSKTSSKDGDEVQAVSTLTAQDFVQGLKQGNKDYLRTCPIIEENREMLKDLDTNWISHMGRCHLGKSYQSFIGPAGRITPLHNESTCFFYVMAEGEKKWTLFKGEDYPLLNPEPYNRGYGYTHFDLKSPDDLHYPGAKYLSRFEATLKKGDILFVPAWMWHQVETTKNSWGVSVRFTSLRSIFQQKTFVFIRAFLAKPSILGTFYYSFLRKDMGTRSKKQLIPKLFLN